MKGLVCLIGLVACPLVWCQNSNGTVRGQVRGPEGQPVVSIVVALAATDENGRVITLPLKLGDFYAGRPDETGMFLIEGVPAGRYGIVASDIRKGEGFFPQIIDETKTPVITVDSGKVTENVNFTFSKLAPSLSGITQHVITGTIAIDASAAPGFNPSQIKLYFLDEPDGRSVDVTFHSDATRPSTQFRFNHSFWSATQSLPRPETPDGLFRFALPEGAYRVSVSRADNSQLGSPDGNGYYVKQMSFGSTDLMKDLMKVNPPLTDRLVIILGLCADAAQNQCRQQQ